MGVKGSSHLHKQVEGSGAFLKTKWNGVSATKMAQRVVRKREN